MPPQLGDEPGLGPVDLQAAPPAIDDDLRRRAEAALRAVRKHKHKKDKHK